jgi:hypothetical protein
MLSKELHRLYPNISKESMAGDNPRDLSTGYNWEMDTNNHIEERICLATTSASITYRKTSAMQIDVRRQAHQVASTDGIPLRMIDEDLR